MFNKKDKRFNVINEESVSMIGINVIQDKETGVNYLLVQGATGMSVTPLLDKDGKPLITTIEQK